MLCDRIKELEKTHGGLRAAARHVGMDAAYMKRLRDKECVRPSHTTCEKLGLTKIIEIKYINKSMVPQWPHTT